MAGRERVRGLKGRACGSGEGSRAVGAGEIVDGLLAEIIVA